MNPTSEDIKDILIDSSYAVGGFAATTGWSIHLGGLPDGVNIPDTAISITDTPGWTPDANNDIDFPGIQILIRGAVGKYIDSWNKAKEIRDVLHGMHGETWGSKYIQILCAGDIGFVHWDDKKRPVFSINFSIQRT